MGVAGRWAHKEEDGRMWQDEPQTARQVGRQTKSMRQLDALKGEIKGKMWKKPKAAGFEQEDWCIFTAPRLGHVVFLEDV